MELSFHCVMCTSMAALNRLRITTVAVGRMQVFPIVADMYVCMYVYRLAQKKLPKITGCF